MIPQKTVAVICEYGLGDSILTLRYAHTVFTHTTKNVIIVTSFRTEFISELISLVQPHFPPFDVIYEGTECFNARSMIRTRHKDFDLHFLNYGRADTVYATDYQWLDKPAFDFKKVVPVRQNQFGKFAVFSNEVLGADRMINDKYWSQFESNWLSKGITPILIGKQPTNQVDVIQRKTNSIRSKFIPCSGTIDLRERTTISDIFWLIANAEECIFPANALAIIANELNKPCMTFIIENNAAYEKRFFYKHGSNLIMKPVKEYL